MTNICGTELVFFFFFFFNYIFIYVCFRYILEVILLLKFYKVKSIIIFFFNILLIIRVSFHLDIYSFGIMIYQLCSGG
jgi:hypothetical protein